MSFYWNTVNSQFTIPLSVSENEKRPKRALKCRFMQNGLKIIKKYR